MSGHRHTSPAHYTPASSSCSCPIVSVFSSQLSEVKESSCPKEVDGGGRGRGWGGRHRLTEWWINGAVVAAPNVRVVCCGGGA
jgi:hypothetical protein